tara:strand:- start:258 stop:917 length:660 start_codon:yes stop_codon:yes gene_type:complete
MKFYFDGDSFTYGGGLKKRGVIPEEVRWSKLVCDYFGAEEINLSCNGASDDRVMRQLFNKPPGEIYDFYFLQTSAPIRFEMYDIKKKKWMRLFYSFSEKTCIERWGSIEGPEIAQWLRFGLNRIYNDVYGTTKENVTYNALKAYVASIGRSKRSFFSTFMEPQCTVNKYDLYFPKDHTSRMKMPPQRLIFDRIPNDGHPSVEGHKTIAKYVIDIVSERL